MKPISPKSEHTRGPRNVAPRNDSGTALSLDLAHVARSLHEEYDQRLGSDLVESEIELVAAKFDDARVRGFVPLLVHRYTEQALDVDCQEAPPVDRDGVAAR